MNNILQLLLSPLTKLGESTKEQTRALTSMESILWRWDNGYNVGQQIEDQTILLGDIKQLLIDQNNHFGVKKGAKGADQKTKDGMVLGDASSFKGLTVKEIGGLAALVIGVSVAIVGAALILQATPIVGIMQLITALAVAGILLLITPAFVKLGDAFFGSKLEKNVDADGSSSEVLTNKGGGKGMGGVFLGILGMLAAVVLGSYLLMAIGQPSGMQILVALAVAILFIPLAYAFSMVVDALSKGSKNSSVQKTMLPDGKVVYKNVGSNPGSLVGAGLLGILGMMAAVVLGSYLLMLVGQPSGMQFLVALGVAIIMIPLAFALGEILTTLAKNKIKGDLEGVKQIGMAMLVIIAGMVALVAASYILMLIGQPSGMQFLVALGVSVIMLVLAFALAKIISTLTDNGVKADLNGVKTMGMAMLLIVTGMLSLVAASYILQLINTDLTMKHFLVAIMVGLTLIPVAFAMGMLIKALSNAGIAGGMEGVKMVLLAGLAIVAMAGAIVGAAWLFLALPDPAELEKKTPPLMWMVVVGLGMLAFALSYSLVLKAMKGATIKEMLLAGAAIVLMALAILGVAWLFTQLPSTWNGPDFEWTAKVGVALVVFAIPFVLIALVMDKTGLGYGDLAKGLVGMIAIAAAIFVISWIFSILPSTFGNIPTDWSLGTAAALTAIGVPMMALATFIGGSGGIGLIGVALGAVGIIIIAIAILAIAWIFNFLPDLGAIGDNLTNFILAPVNGIIDLLVRLKNEVGVSELIPLAIGIGAISVALLLLAGATAGLAAGGVLGALGNAASEFVDGITDFFGGEKSKGPLDILDDLISKRAAIIELAPAFEKLAKAAQMLLYVDAVVQSLNRFMTVLVMSGMGGLSVSELVDDLAESVVKLKDSFQGFSLQPFQVLMQLFAMVKMIEITSKVMGELAKHFTSFAMQAYIAGEGLAKIAYSYVMMGTVTADQLNPSIQFLVELQKDTYQRQADALTQMAPAILAILGTGGSQGKSLLGMLIGEDHPVVAILKALRSASGAVVSMAPAMVDISGAFYKIAHSPVIAYNAATKFAKVLNDSTFDKQADALERVAEAYKSIAESSNRMNIISIGKTTDMIHALGYLSKQGGQGAVEALGDKLVLAIEELGNLIEKYSGQGGGDGGDSLIDKAKNLVGLGDNKNNNTGGADMSKLLTAINSLKSSIEDGIEVTGNVRIVQ